MTATIAAHRTEGFALGLALSALDAAATWLWLTLGFATEANPVIAGVIESQGLTAAMGTRALLGLVWFLGFRILATRTKSKLAAPAHLAAIGLLAALSLYHLTFGIFTAIA